MKLTLRFRGELPSNGRPEEKHAIRLQLHSQLQAYWQKDSRLKDISKSLKGLQVPELKSGRFEVTRPIKGRQNFFWRHPLCGHNFVPLVTGVRESHCHLTLRFYRNTEDEGILFHGGDIDNRLKRFSMHYKFHKQASKFQHQAATHKAIQENGRRYSA